MKRSDLRVLKYRTIKNTYHDTALARRAREWSEERIYKELGITLPKSIPKLRKDVSERYQKKLKTQLYKYQATRDKLLNSGVNEDEAIKIARKNRKKSYKKINKIIDKYFNKNIDVTFDDYTDYSESHIDRFFTDYIGLTFSERVRQWAYWAKHNAYPDEIIQAVTRINKEKSLDKDHSLGWAVVYQGFLKNQDINILKDKFIQDKFLPEMYKEVVKVNIVG